MPAYVAEDGSIQEVPSLEGNLHIEKERTRRATEKAESERAAQVAADQVVAYRERRAELLAAAAEERERLAVEEAERLAPWLAESDRLARDLQRAHGLIRELAFVVDASTDKALKKSVERQIQLTAAVTVGERVEQAIRVHESNQP
jgi:hypothetical protein